MKDFSKQRRKYNGEENLDWENMGFSYMQTDKRYVANYKDGKWDDGALIDDANIVMNECAGVLQYSQSVFEGTESVYDGRRTYRYIPPGSERFPYGGFCEAS